MLLRALVALGFGFGVLAQAPAGFVEYNSPNGPILLQEDRQPALYTESFGDCLGGSLLDISRFDAELWLDNLTVGFHLEGNSLVEELDVILYLGVWAYGESRFSKIFNPCGSSIRGLCPTNLSIPIEAAGIVPVSPQDLSGIPSIAFNIPDFEGQAILRVFSNSSQSEIACFSAAITNGATFSHPQIIGTLLGIFLVTNVVTSFATAIYGDSISSNLPHYAHSMSVLVSFACIHHVFYTGALSMNWPTALPAFWSNFAPFSGMIFSSSLSDRLNSFLGVDVGNTSIVGASPQGSPSDGVAGGYSSFIENIYRRGLPRTPASMDDLQEVADALARRQLEDASDGWDWYGPPVQAGMPLPGNSSGFAGTLAAESLPASQAFLTGLIWFLVLLSGMLLLVVLFKGSLELGSRRGLVDRNTFSLFRRNWVLVALMVAGRILCIGFFPIVFLSIFQFVYEGPPATMAVAAVVLVLFTGGLGVACFLAFHKRIERTPNATEAEKSSTAMSKLGVRLRSTFRLDLREDPHSERFLRRFGWLSARFRRSRWFFFAAWFVYELVRALFYAGAAGHPQVQVFGLLAVEIVAFLAIWAARPFEGQRLNVLTVYLLGFSKVSSIALSAAFDPHFNLDRITATAIAFVIIVIQSLLILAMMVLIILGAMSARMSLTRNKELGPESADWAKLRGRYFEHIAKKEEFPTRPASGASQEFRLSAVRRIPKIEEFDEHEAAAFDAYGSHISVAPESPGTRPSRTNSVRSDMSYSNLPFGARPHRMSWSSRDMPAPILDGRIARASSASLIEKVERPRSGRRSGQRASSYDGLPLPPVPEGHWRSRRSTFIGGRLVDDIAEAVGEGVVSDTDLDGASRMTDNQFNAMRPSIDISKEHAGERKKIEYANDYATHAEALRDDVVEEPNEIGVAITGHDLPHLQEPSSETVLFTGNNEVAEDIAVHGELSANYDEQSIVDREHYQLSSSANCSALPPPADYSDQTGTAASTAEIYYVLTEQHLEEPSGCVGLAGSADINEEYSNQATCEIGLDELVEHDNPGATHVTRSGRNTTFEQDISGERIQPRRSDVGKVDELKWRNDAVRAHSF